MDQSTNVSRRTFTAGMGMGMGMLSFMGALSATGAAQAAQAAPGQPTIEEIQAAEIAAAKAENRRLDPVKYVTTLSHSELEDMLATEAEVTEDYVTPNGKVIPAVYVALRNRINRCGGGIGSIVSGDDHWDVYMNFWTEDDARHTLEMPMNKWFIANEFADKTGRTEAEAAAILDDMADRALIWRVQRTGLAHYSVMGQIPGYWEWKELNIVNNEGDEMGALWNQGCNTSWGEDRPIGSLYQSLVHVHPCSRDVVEGELSPWSDWEAAIERHSKFAVMDCQCRTKARTLGTTSEECDCRLETCTSMGEIAEYFISCGAAREVTKDEARAIIQANVDEGNTIEAFCNKSGGAWCSCNVDCCQFAAAYKAFGGALNSMPFISDYNLAYDKDACLKCGACQTRCPMKAIEVDEDGYFVATSMCFRCGQCGMTCPVGARKLVLKEKWETFEWGADVVDDCLTAAKLHMALGGIVDFTGDVDAVREAVTFKVI